jgi:cytosine/uracil/thiamine/allantoin permease
VIRRIYRYRTHFFDSTRFKEHLEWSGLVLSVGIIIGPILILHLKELSKVESAAVVVSAVIVLMLVVWLHSKKFKSNSNSSNSNHGWVAFVVCISAYLAVLATFLANTQGGQCCSVA